MSREKASAEPMHETDESVAGEAPAHTDASSTPDGHDQTQSDGNEEIQNAESDTESTAEAEADTLKEQLDAANMKADQNWDAVLRTRAEMENLRKRQTRELENAHKFALDKIAMELLPVRDTLEMGVAAATEEADVAKIAEGTELTLKMLTQALEKFNIAEVDPVGEKFDPDLHQAISMQENSDKPVNTVLSVMQKGYTLNDRLLRPAMVIIAK